MSELEAIVPDDLVESSPLQMLLDDLRRLTDAGNELAAAAHRVSTTYDGVHRLRIALAHWYQALADENGRGRNST